MLAMTTYTYSKHCPAFTNLQLTSFGFSMKPTLDLLGWHFSQIPDISLSIHINYTENSP
jgi:hypothetical protein